MAKSKNDYQKAYDELQAIVARLQNDEIGLDDLSISVQRATELMKLCKEKLRSVESEIGNMLEDKA